ncbi:MAG: sensor histidine kinase [Bacteroidetes bacterium]|nr:sensor histidine kinase [Bacteroidota bacterium]
MVIAFAGLCNEYSYNDPEKALMYGHKGLILSEKIGFVKGVAMCCNNIGVVYYSQNNNQKALDYYQKSLKIFEYIGSEKEISDCFKNIGKICNKEGKCRQALEYYQKSLEIIEKYRDKRRKASCYFNIGNIHQQQRNYRLALKYYLVSLDICEELDDKKGIAYCYNNLGNNYSFQDSLSLALEYYKKSLEIYKLVGDKIGESTIYINIGVIYTKQGNLNNALEYYKKSLKINEELNDEKGLSACYTNISDLNLTLKNYRQALYYGYKALTIAKKIGALDIIQTAYYNLSIIHDSLGNIKDAFRYYKLYSETNDSIVNKESQKKIAEMEVKYGTEKKEKEIVNLQKEKTVNELQLTKQRNLKYIFILSGIIFLLSSLFLFAMFHQKKKNNEILTESNRKITASEYELKELNSTKDKFFSIISHDIKGPLNSFKQITRFLKTSYNTLNDGEKYSYIHEINKSAEQLYSFFQNLLQWSLSQKSMIKFNPEEIDLSVLIFKTTELLKPTADKKRITIVSDIKENSLDFCDKYMILTVLRNLLSNAINFSNHAGTITNKISYKDEFIELSIKDNGIGMSDEDVKKLFKIDVDHKTIGTSEDKGTGLGLILCKEFIEKNGGKIWVESQADIGSTFTFTLPTSRVG